MPNMFLCEVSSLRDAFLSRFPRKTLNVVAGMSGLLGYLLLGINYDAGGIIAFGVIRAIGLALIIPAVVITFDIAAIPSHTRTSKPWIFASMAIAAIVVGVVQIIGLISQDIAVFGDNNLSYRDWLLSGRPDLLILIGCLLLGLRISADLGGEHLRRFGLFFGAAAALTIVTNACWLGIGDFSVLMTPDSPTYLYRNACRTPGYLAFLTPFKHVDARWVVIAQVNILIAAQIALALSVLRLTSSTLAGIAVLAFLVPLNKLISASFYVGTEPLFSSALAFAAAAAISYIRAPSIISALALGLSITAAFGIKAVAPIELVAIPFLLLRETENRRDMLLPMLMPPLLGLCVLIVIGRISNGSWAPTNFTGYALAENVAWGIRSDERSSDPELAATLETKLRDRQNAWPSMWNPDAYLSYSMANLDGMFWGEIVPAVTEKQNLGGGAPHCPTQVNHSLIEMAKETIAREPVRYLIHSAIQFYGLWAFAAAPQPWTNSIVRTRINLTIPMSNWYWRGAPESWKPSAARLGIIDAAGVAYDARRLFIDDVFSTTAHLASTLHLSPATLETASTGAIVWKGDTTDAIAAARELQKSATKETSILPFLGTTLLILTVTFSIFTPLAMRGPAEVAALSMLSLQINTYFAAQALFMFATPRYATCVEALLAAFIAILIKISGGYIYKRAAASFRSNSG